MITAPHNKNTFSYAGCPWEGSELLPGEVVTSQCAVLTCGAAGTMVHTPLTSPHCENQRV